MSLNTTNSYASIRRSERLAKKAVYFEESFSVPSVRNTDRNTTVGSSVDNLEPRRERASIAVDFHPDPMESRDSVRGTFGRQSVRRSIRRSLQPLANMLTTGRKRKGNKCEPLYEDPANMSCVRNFRNTVRKSTLDFDEALPPGRAQGAPNSGEPQEIRRVAPACPRPVRKVPREAPKPMPRTSILRQENAPPIPPRRQSIEESKPPLAANPLKESLRELRNLEPRRVLRTIQEIPVNSPKRKICVENFSEETADDENSLVEWNPDRKRRKTVRYQSNSSLWLLKGSGDAGSGKAKLRLSVYVNCGHISLHVIRGANLPLLPDQHELNSYIKVAVEPRDCRVQHRSQIVPATVDPFYDFRLSFEFPATPTQDEQPTLLVTVWHRDSNSRRSRLLGFLSFPISKIVEANRIEGWFRLPSLAITKKTQL
ncbi:uncharacterized protein LOC100908221 [Galendromus occidentalis]|uniref:Uncharacterized protein LOC100908221 n=1 Tax=Galendromus occidentalis TaxID=34638 RepID=A0AAJ6VXY3_9ACAR|nr:uncharacterized protein LOC100908221 [Galendromus occidentalis]